MAECQRGANRKVFQQQSLSKKMKNVGGNGFGHGNFFEAFPLSWG